MRRRSVQLVECALADLGALDHGYARGSLPTSRHPLLVVRIEGSAGNDADRVFDLASAIVMAGLEAWEPSALVLDLRRLSYAWGDRMSNVLGAAQRWYEPLLPLRKAFCGDGVPSEFPLAVVVSDLSREGLTSLVRDELRRDPHTYVFSSVEEAAHVLDQALADVPLM